MKILKIKVLSNNYGEMVYPQGFTSIGCLEHIYCDDVKAGICYLVVAIKDEDILKMSDMTNMQELTEQEAEVFLNEYDPIREEITDEAKMRRLEIKAKTGIALTTDDLKALDPNDPTPGINYHKRFMDKVKARK